MCGRVLMKKILFGLAVLCGSACGTEPAPWSGFALFPGPDASVSPIHPDPERPVTTSPVPAASSEPAASSGGEPVAGAVMTPVQAGSPAAAAGSGAAVAVQAG